PLIRLRLNGERNPRNTKPANEGGPVSRQSRGISLIWTIAILPENRIRRKSHFWLRRKALPKIVRALRRDLIPKEKPCARRYSVRRQAIASTATASPASCSELERSCVHASLAGPL